MDTYYCRSWIGDGGSSTLSAVQWPTGKTFSPLDFYKAPRGGNDSITPESPRIPAFPSPA